MAVTRIKNNQITDTTIQANAKVVPYTVTAGLLANNLVYGSDLTVTGNLTVQGTSTTIDTTITTIEDPVILLASTQTGSPSVDIGYIGRRGTSPNIAMVWKESASEFVTAFTSTGETSTTITVTGYANLHTGNANIGGNIVINGTTSLVGNLASANVTGNINGGNLLTAGIVSATANITGGNVLTGGLISATSTITSSATITGGNLATGGTISGTGNITGGNVLTGGIMSSTGNATHGNILTGGIISGTGNITGGNVLTGGLVSATGNVTSAANVSGGNVVTGGLISATATITGGNLATGGTISATANITGGNVLTGGLISATGNVSGGNLITTGAGGSISGSGNITGGNILTGGVVSAAGNITSGAGSFFIGNGSQLTGVTATSAGFPVSAGTSNINAISSGNIFVGVGGTPNVTVFTTTGVSVAGTVAANGTITGGNLATGGTASATGNITGGNLLTGGVASAGGNVTGANIVTGGQVTATGSVIGGSLWSNGTISAVGNAIAGNVTTAGQVSATANITGGNLLTGGLVSATANITGGNLLTGGLISATSTITSGANVIGGNLTTAGQVSATANVTGGNVLTGGLISATATITGGNLATGGTISGTGNITGGNVSTAGQVSATANVTGGNVLTGGLISATATITGGNLATGGTASATGNITGGNVLTGGLMSATGNITGANLNSAQLYSSGALTITNASGNINLTPAGNLVLNNKYINGVSQPVQDNDAASKIYVDNLVSTQISYHQAVSAATTTTLATTTGGTITYTQPNGAANGVGALLTTTGSFNLIDTANVQTVGIRILVKNEANAVYNGIYTWANATNIVRSTDADEYGANSITQLSLNDYFFVTSGNVNAGSAWIVDAPSGTITFGTSNITFAQFSQSQVYTAGNGVSINGTVISAKVDNNTTAFDGAGNIIVKAGANLTTPNIGAATGTSVSVTGTVSGSSVVGGVMTGSSVSVTGTVTGASVVGGVITGTSVSVSGNVTGGNVNTGGQVSATANVTGGNVLTGGLISATSTITSSANVTGGNILTAGIMSSTGNATHGNILTGGLISATATITGGNLATGGTASATGNITGGNILTAGLISATGNISTANSVIATGVSGTGVSAGIFGNVSNAQIHANAILQVAGNTPNSYVQIAFQNLSNTANASTDLALYNASGTDTAYFIDMGITSPTFNGTNYGANVYGANDGYLYVVGNSQTGPSGSGANIGNLVLGATTGKIIQFIGNQSTDNIITTTSSTGFTVTGVMSASGNVTGGNILTGGIVSTVGNITAGTAAAGYVFGNAYYMTGLSAAVSVSKIVNGTSYANIASSNGNLVVAIGASSNTVATFYDQGVNFTGPTSASGNVTGGNLLTGGLMSATGNITGGNLISSGNVFATSAANVQFNDNTWFYSGYTTMNTGGIFHDTGANPDTIQVSTNSRSNGIAMWTNGVANSYIVSTGGFEFFTGGTLRANTNPTGGTSTAQITSSGLTVSGIISATANVTGGNVLTGGLISATSTITSSANVIGGNLTTTGQVSATANITGGNVLTGGLISATATITGGNLATGGTASATGNVTAGNLITAGNLVVNGGNIDSSASAITINGASADVNFAVNGDTTTVFFVDAGTETASFGNSTQVTNSIVSFNSTNSIKMPVGNTAQRPTGVTGQLRFNTTTNGLEVFDNSAWTAVGTPTFTVISDQQFSGDGSTVAFTLSTASTTAGSVVSINGVVQIPTTAYSISSTTLTFTEAPATGDQIDVRTFTTTTSVTSISNSAGNAVISTSETAAQINVTGNLVPTANVTYNLGSSSLRWKDAYFSGTSITLGNVVIKNVAGGNTVGFYGPDGTTPANIAASSVDTTQITSGTSNMSVVSSNGNIRANIAGTTVMTISPGLVDIVGNLTVSGNATLQGNILGDRVQNGTTSIDIQTPSGNANITIGGTSNVAVFTTTGVNVTGVMSASGNVTGGNVLTGGLISATGNINAGNLIITGVLVDNTGNLELQSTATNGNINLTPNGTGIVGISTSLSVTGNITGGNVLGGANVNATTHTGTTVSVTANVTGGNILTGGLISSTGNITGGNLTVGTGTITGGNIVNSNANGVGNIGSSTVYYNTVFAKATSAQYADLAEKYTADAEYTPGTVVSFGGSAEVTVTSTDADRRVAGVVSTNPSYTMNSGLQGEHVVTVALTGRVPTQVIGLVRKGDMMVSAGAGRARAEADPKVGTVIGKALEDFNGDEGVIEVVVGRF
jgi:hypothetical protein